MPSIWRGRSRVTTQICTVLPMKLLSKAVALIARGVSVLSDDMARLTWSAVDGSPGARRGAGRPTRGRGRGAQPGATSGGERAPRLRVRAGARVVIPAPPCESSASGAVPSYLTQPAAVLAIGPLRSVRGLTERQPVVPALVGAAAAAILRRPTHLVADSCGRCGPHLIPAECMSMIGWMRIVPLRGDP